MADTDRPVRSPLHLAFVLSAAAVAMPASPSMGAGPAAIDFARDVRPVLSRHCFACHGADPEARKAGLRLDTREGATAELKSGAVAVAPDAPDESEMIARVIETDESLRMPPRKHGEPLTQAEVDVLRRWVSEGAEYARHWAFDGPVARPLPEVKASQWPRGGTDSWVLTRLEEEGLAPAPEADRYVLLRRASLDLRGLPPSPQEVEAFAADGAPDAYEKAVDRFMADPAFGERWARLWLDLARYADSAGYGSDPLRTIWRYRDWVIDAFNRNLPYDRFTVEQIAGDLLPGATLEQKTATAFHRNTMTNTEGGTDDEEFRVAAVKDRVDATWQVWMGLTMGCAKCHTHKYDPITHEDYYKFFAVFNQTEDSDKPDESPVVPNPTVRHESEARQAEARIAEAKARLESESASLAADRERWESERVGPIAWHAANNEQGTSKGAVVLPLLRLGPAPLAATFRWAKSDGDPKNALVSVSFDTRAALRAGLPARAAEGLDLPAERRNGPQREAVDEAYRSSHPTLKKLADAVASLEKARPAPPTVPVMAELTSEKRRETFIMVKGNFLTPGAKVSPGVPEAFPPLPEGAQADRLSVARWLVGPQNPLTARVAVNRYWSQLFGTGLVESEEDFGTQGEPPSHPELLDWLALRFIELDWDAKALLRELVTSATYRQSSRVTPELLEKDPKNRLMSRGPRFRLEAETVRDQALALGGLLSRKVGGPSVFPPQPDGLWQAAFNGQRTWATSGGDDRHRRGLYTFWRRTVPYPSMAAFDAPSREICAVRRIRTNTPLQAFVTMNDPVYVEASQALARRVVAEGGSDDESRARFALALVLCRPPAEPQVARLLELVRTEKAHYAGDLEAARALATDPLGPLPEGADAAEHAAWTAAANVLLNLDAVLTKG